MNRRSARLTHLGTLATGAALLIAAWGTVSEPTNPVGEAALVLTADVLFESIQRGAFPPGFEVPEFYGRPERMPDSFKAIGSRTDVTRSAGIPDDPIIALWQTFDRSTKAQILLAVKDANDPSFAYTVTGHLLLSGVEQDVGVLEHLVSTLSWLDPGVPQISRWVGETVIEQGVPPEIAVFITELLL